MASMICTGIILSFLPGSGLVSIHAVGSEGLIVYTAGKGLDHLVVTETMIGRRGVGASVAFLREAEVLPSEVTVTWIFSLTGTGSGATLILVSSV